MYVCPGVRNHFDQFPLIKAGTDLQISNLVKSMYVFRVAKRPLNAILTISEDFLRGLRNISSKYSRKKEVVLVLSPTSVHGSK